MAWTRLGLRREVLLLLPAAMLLLVLVSTFTLLSYRNAVRDGIEQRRSEAARLAQALSSQVSPQGAASTLELLAQAPGARSVSLLDDQGRSISASGDLPSTALSGSLLERIGDEPVGIGPDADLGPLVVGIAPLGGGTGKFLRVDLADAGLGSHQRSLRLLSVVVLGVNSAVSLLVFFFLRHLLAPWEVMLEKARAVGEERPADHDEVGFLLATFERAVVARSREALGRTEDDIAALQRALSASLESGLLLLDRGGTVLALNPVGRELLRLGEEEAAGSSLATVLASHPALRELLQRAVEQGEGIQRHELEIATPAGVRTLGLTVHVLRRDDQAVRGYLVLFADLTESRRRAEEARLAEGLAQLGEMAAGVAHELRNSLATLRGYLTLVERRPQDGDLADYLQEIRRETDHLRRVLEDFLIFARPGTSRPQEVSMAAVLRRATADPALGEAAVELAMDGPEATLLGDEQLLEHALRNLLRNAVQAQREAGVEQPLQVRLSTREDGLRVQIDDAGGGVPQEVAERLFQPFASGFKGGVGLGLAVSHRIVSLHGGRLRLERLAGGGTRAEAYFAADRIVTKGNSRHATAAGPVGPATGRSD